VISIDAFYGSNPVGIVVAIAFVKVIMLSIFVFLLYENDFDYQ